jgi:hypothetical protein
MKKQALGAITVLIVLATVLWAGCTMPMTRNNTFLSNVSEMGNGSTRSPVRNNITTQFNTLAGNASKTLNSSAHEARVILHFLNNVIQLVTDTTQDLHSNPISTSYIINDSFSTSTYQSPFL